MKKSHKLLSNFNVSTNQIWIVAGEASGDMHGAALLHQLKKLFPESQFYGIGGSNMEKEGLILFNHINQLAVMGFSEIIGKISSIYKIFRSFVKEMKIATPQALILIDFPDFNLRLAKKAFKAGVPVIYYISPQLWAWRKKRIKIIKKYVNKMIVIFPFEKKFYQKNGVDVTYTGYPLTEKLQLNKFRNETIRRGFLSENSSVLVGILPGSRNSEVKKILPKLLQGLVMIKNKFPEVSFVLPKGATIDEALITKILQKVDLPIKIVNEKAHDVMGNADLLFVASGTATLEATCMTTPMIVVYRISGTSYAIARKLVKVPYIAMPNLIAEQKIVPELVQKDLNSDNIFEIGKYYLEDRNRLRIMRNQLQNIREQLQGSDAYLNAAEAIETALT